MAGVLVALGCPRIYEDTCDGSKFRTLDGLDESHEP